MFFPFGALGEVLQLKPLGCETAVGYDVLSTLPAKFSSSPDPRLILWWLEAPNKSTPTTPHKAAHPKTVQALKWNEKRMKFV